MSALLGIPDEEVKDEFEVSWNTNKIGGQPSWMYAGCQLPVCPVCGAKLKLVVQLYCPLQDSPYHRTLYISTCVNKQCWNKPHSWSVQRCQMLDQSKTSSQNEKVVSKVKDSWGADEDSWGDTPSDMVAMETKDWCDGADDWGDDSEVNVAMVIGLNQNNSNNQAQNLENLKFEQMNIIEDNIGDSSDTSSNHSNSSEQISNIVQIEADFLDKDSMQHVKDLLASDETRSSSLKELKPQDPSISMETVFNSFFLSVVNENDFKLENLKVEHLIKNYEQDSGTDLKTLIKSKSYEGEGQCVEQYEKSDIKGDKYSYKFLKRLKVCPQQCIRYDWNSQPMFISQPSADCKREITCSHCKTLCIFELQLMPPLVNILANQHGETSEFGTVLVYTCKNSCWSSKDSVRYETCIVQPDPDSHLFK